MAFILKKVEDFSKEEIKNLVAKNCKVLDKNLELIGESLETRSERLWDLAGIDDKKRLVLINVELRYTDKMLYQIVNRLDWAWENMGNIALFASLPVLAVLLRRRPHRISVTAILVLLLMFVTGAYRTGETARACMFIYPFLFLTLKDLPAPFIRRLVAAAGIQTIVMQALGSYGF